VDGLPTLDLPALLLHGEGDPMPSSASIETAALIPGAAVTIIDQAGHFPWLERPGDFRLTVGAFLAEHATESQVDPTVDPAPVED
jgi:pimeloyl-ACP methyl ester carboxylesterase